MLVYDDNRQISMTNLSRREFDATVLELTTRSYRHRINCVLNQTSAVHLVLHSLFQEGIVMAAIATQQSSNEDRK